jgi:hypothetical protein
MPTAVGIISTNAVGMNAHPTTPPQGGHWHVDTAARRPLSENDGIAPSFSYSRGNLYEELNSLDSYLRDTFCSPFPKRMRRG